MRFAGCFMIDSAEKYHKNKIKIHVRTVQWQMIIENEIALKDLVEIKKNCGKVFRLQAFNPTGKRAGSCLQNGTHNHSFSY